MHLLREPKICKAKPGKIDERNKQCNNSGWRSGFHSLVEQLGGRPEDWNSTTNHLDLTDVYRMLHQTEVEYTFFSIAYEI